MNGAGHDLFSTLSEAMLGADAQSRTPVLLINDIGRLLAGKLQRLLIQMVRE
jgi:hypothetical protein